MAGRSGGRWRQVLYVLRVQRLALQGAEQWAVMGDFPSDRMITLVCGCDTLLTPTRAKAQLSGPLLHLQLGLDVGFGLPSVQRGTGIRNVGLGMAVGP